LYFQTRILFVSFLATVILSIFLIPVLKRLKIGQTERTDGPKSHFKKEGTPTMGGIIIALGIIIGTIGGYIYYFAKEPYVGERIFPLILITIGFGIIGFIDDFKKLVLKDTKGLKPRYKIIGLLIIAVAYIIYLIKIAGIGTETFIPFIKEYIEIPLFLYIPFAILVMLAMTNAINLTDGIDGLSTSIAAIIATCLTVIAIILDVKEIIVFGSIIVGVCLGFLIFNLNKAKVFMGDTRITSFRWSNFYYGSIFKNASDFIANSSYTGNRDRVCVITGNIFQKNWAEKDCLKWHLCIIILNYLDGKRIK